MGSTPVTASHGPVRRKPRWDARPVTPEKVRRLSVQLLWVLRSCSSLSACPGASSGRGGRSGRAPPARLARGKGHSPHAARRDPSGGMSRRGKSISSGQARAAGRGHVGLDRSVGRGGGKGPPQPLLRAAPRGGLNAKGRRRGMRSSGGCGAPRPPRRQPARQGSGPAAAASALPGTAAGCQAAAPAGDGAEGRPAAALPRPACSPPSRSACGRGERSLLRRDGQPSAAQPQAPLGLKSPWLRGPGGAATSKWHGRETVEVKASHH